MATRQPRKPRAFKQIGPTQRPMLRGAESGLSMIRRLEKQYEQAQRKVAAEQRRQERRSRRLQDPNELVADSAPMTFEDVTTYADEPSSLMPWLSNPAEQAIGPGGVIVDRPEPGARTPGSGQLMPWLSPQSEEAFDPFDDQDINRPTATEWYAPTKSSYPPRPRTRTMRYDRERRILTIQYRDGGTYDYFDVPSSIWYRIRQVRSPGRFIDRNIRGVYEYERVSL